MSTCCKDIVQHHPQAQQSYYVDLDMELPVGVTLTSATATPVEDATLQVVSVSILATDTVVNGHALKAQRTVVVKLTGGTPTQGSITTPVLVTAARSDGDTHAGEYDLAIRGTV